MNKLKVGIVGAGAISVESHIPVLKSLKNVEVTGVCDKQTSLAKSASEKFSIPKTFEDIDAMLKDDKYDVIDICAPPFTHASIATKAMNAGCNVLTEKPMATSAQDADLMIAAAKKNNVRLGVVHQNLFNPAIIKAKELVVSGAMGDLLHVELRTSEDVDSELCTNPNHWCHKLPGGIFYEIIPHPVYLSQFFLEDVKPVAVMARKLSNRAFMKNDELRVLLEGKNGIGEIIASCNSHVHGDTLDIFGSKLALHADLWGRSVILYKAHGRSPMSVGIGNLSLSAQLFKVLGTTASTFVKAARGKASAHYFVISQYIQSLIDNKEFTTTAERGRATVAMLDQICGQI